MSSFGGKSVHNSYEATKNETFRSDYKDEVVNQCHKLFFFILFKKVYGLIKRCFKGNNQLSNQLKKEKNRIHEVGTPENTAELENQQDDNEAKISLSYHPTCPEEDLQPKDGTGVTLKIQKLLGQSNGLELNMHWMFSLTLKEPTEVHTQEYTRKQIDLLSEITDKFDNLNVLLNAFNTQLKSNELNLYLESSSVTIVYNQGIGEKYAYMVLDSLQVYGKNNQLVNMNYTSSNFGLHRVLVYNTPVDNSEVKNYILYSKFTLTFPTSTDTNGQAVNLSDDNSSEFNKPTFRLNVISADVFRSSLRNTQTISLELTYSRIYPNNCRLFIDIPVIRHGLINRQDEKSNLVSDNDI